MNRIRRAAYVATAVLWLLALLGGLWFAGLFSSGDQDAPHSAAEESTAEESSDQPRLWEIVYRGMKFFLPQKGMVGLHASGCLNIRQDERYLIQIEIREGTLEERWEKWSANRELLLESGYRIEKEAEWLLEEGSECIRYVISLEKERGSDFDRTYSEVILSPADEGRFFLTVVWYDKIDVEKLDEAMREKIYEEAFVRASAVLAGTCPTDEADDETETYWTEDKNLDPEHQYVSEDTIVYRDGKYSLSYQLPEHCMLTADNIAGKTYYDEDEQVYVYTNVLKHYATAKAMAESRAEAELSRPHTSGKTEVNGRMFYYYTQTVVEYGKNKTVTTYKFNGYCDLEDGSVYTISGFSEKSPKTVEPDYYLEWMHITVF